MPQRIDWDKGTDHAHSVGSLPGAERVAQIPDRDGGRVMRRRRALVSFAVAVGVAWLAWVAAILWLRRDRPEVSLTTMSWLTPGLSEAEVAAVLGPPTNDITRRLPARFPPPAVGSRVLEYAGEKATAAVEFDSDGRLVRAYPIDIRVVTGLERVRLRLHWW